MPSNSEMYERGALDAEQDELNPFYYQHYYYYRRGYDDSRRRQRRSDSKASPLLFGLAAVVALALGFWLFGGRTTPAAPPTSAPAAVAATTAPSVAVATSTPAATATPEPTAAPTLAVGGRARVANLSGAPLRARQAPGLGGAVVARIPEGSEVAIREGPVEADGLTWWRVEAPPGTGWVAAGSAEGVAFLEPLAQ